MNGWRVGDIFFGWGHGDWASWAIRWGTMGPSHVGIVVGFDPEGLLLVEATTLLSTPCLVKHSRAGVQANDITTRISHYTANGGKVERWRLAAGRRLSQWQANELSTIAWRDYLGKDYDTRQAIGSGANVTKWWLKRRLGWLGFGAEDRTKFFCSELVICLLQEIQLIGDRINASDYSPADLLRLVRSQGMYQREAVFT